MMHGKICGVTYFTKFGFIVVCVLCLISISRAEDEELKSSPLAAAFGSQPDFLSLSLSPDGEKLAFIQYHPDGYDFLRILDLNAGKISGMIMSSPLHNVDTEISWCTWANKERLLCSLVTRYSYDGAYTHTGEMVAVNLDGKGLKKLKGWVIDKLPDDPKHVLVQIYDFSSSTTFDGNVYSMRSRSNSRIGTLDIYTGKVTNKSYPQSAVQWISDGHGVPRLYHFVNDQYRRWYLRKPKDNAVYWDTLHEVTADDLTDHFLPQGFADNPDELLYLDVYDGRIGLFSMDLAHDRATNLVFAHDRFDVMGVQTLGKFNRVVAATYVDNKLRHHFFDKDIQKIYELVTPLFPDQNVDIVDEDWNRRYYIITVSSDVNPKVYYRYDSNSFKLMRIASISAKLEHRKLAVMKEITYPARDKVSVPAFLTLPNNENRTGLPAVILPHGGPGSRDVWDFDILAQFLAANGYAVLQSNYRGSTGYGLAWNKDGAFRNWKTAVNDVNDGVTYLINQGIADPDRICVVGWSYGGYAALMGAIEDPSLYKCIVSIAGVTDPKQLGFNVLKYVGGETNREFIGADEVGDAGSPIKRANEIQVPVFLAHAEEDGNVPFKQSENMYEALINNKQSVEFIHYKQAEHDIRPEKYRIDLFTRLAEFLDKYTK